MSAPDRAAIGVALGRIDQVRLKLYDLTSRLAAEQGDWSELEDMARALGQAMDEIEEAVS